MTEASIPWKRASIVLWALSLSVGMTGVPKGEATSNDQVDSLKVCASGPGRLFLGGNMIVGPWTLSYKTGRLTVNGYAVRKFQALPQPTSAVKLTEGEFLLRVKSFVDSLNWSKTSTSQKAEALYAYCLTNTIGMKVKREGDTVTLRTADGYALVFAFQEVGAGLPNGWKSETTRGRFNRMKLLKSVLERGGVVVLRDSGSYVLIQPWGTEAFLRGVRTLKVGAEPDSEAAHYIGMWTRNQIQNPLPLYRPQ
jgi:hypothetical protein